MRGHDLAAGVHQHEAAGAVGVLDHARLPAGLAEGRRLLVAGDAGDGHGLAQPLGLAVAIDLAARTDLGQELARHVEQAQQFLVPLARVQVEEQGARSVGDVGDMAASAGELPDQPGVDGAGGELAAGGARPRLRNVVEQPLQLGAGEVGIEQEAGLLLEGRRQAGGGEFRAHIGAAPVLPDDGRGERTAAVALPEHDSLALVGDADRGQRFGTPFGRRFGSRQRRAGDFDLALPDFLGIVLDPSGLREVLAEFALRPAADVAVDIEQQRPRTAGALVQGEDESLAAHGLFSDAISWSRARTAATRSESVTSWNTIPGR
ncbi:hypothetical protein GALL_399530 [mine drainage metagenome]|uniref:Uncharacterized protein n=1 Tax=mine drainage metagenome TaxID=410659 RepID=A0A1J5Q3Q8_9ZZZZ